MKSTEKAIRDFCGHHADWWPSITQVQELMALAQPCSTCEALARTVMMDQTSHDQFKPNWNTEAVLVEEMQRMAKRNEELAKQCTAQEFSDCTGGFEIFDKEKFAELIRADERDACERAVEELLPDADRSDCAEAIRARSGEQK